MAALSLILALSALWTGPIWGQDRSWAGSIDPVRVSTLPGNSGSAAYTRYYIAPTPSLAPPLSSRSPLVSYRTPLPTAHTHTVTDGTEVRAITTRARTVGGCCSSPS